MTAPPPLPTERELRAIDFPAPRDGTGAVVFLVKATIYAEQEKQNRQRFVRWYAALDPPIGLRRDERAIAAEQTEQLAAMVAEATQAEGAPTWSALPLFGGTPQRDFDALAESNPAVRYALEDLRQKCILDLEEDGRDPCALARARSYREIMAAIPAGGRVASFALSRLSYARVWPEVREAWRRLNGARLGAANVVAADPELADDAEAVADLAREVERGGRLAVCMQAMGLPLSDVDLAALGEREGTGLHELAARFVDYARGQLGVSAEREGVLRAGQSDEWKQATFAGAEPYWTRWRNPVLPSRLLAAELWHAEVRAQVAARKEAAGRLGCAALTDYALDQLLPGMTRGLRIESGAGALRALVPNGRPIAFEVATVDADRLLAVVARGVPRLGSLNAVRALTWYIRTTFEQLCRRVTDFRVIPVDGGWEAWPALVGAGESGKAADELREIAHAHAAWRWQGPRKDESEGNLIALEVERAHTGHRARVIFTIGTMLVPHYGDHWRQRQDSRAREAKALTPITALPPVVGAPVHHGPQAVLSWRVLREMRDRCSELVQHGGVALPLSRFVALAAEVNLSPQVASVVLDRWTQDGDKGPRFLERIERGDRYTLGPEHAAARDFLIAAAKREIRGSKGGLATKARKDGGSRRGRKRPSK